MGWRPYGDCCRTRAAEGAAICGACGNSLFRCPGHSECGQLLDPEDHCPSHVRPSLLVTEEGLAPLVEGDFLSLPFKLANPADSATLEHVKVRFRLTSGHGDWTDVEMGRSTLHPGREVSFHVDLDPLPPGQQRLRLQVDLVARLGPVAERYVFEAAVLLRVTAKQTGTIQIQKIQNIDNSGAHFGTGASGVVQTGDSLDIGSLLASEKASQVPPLSAGDLKRNRSAEFENHARGYTTDGGASLRLLRDVEMAFLGIPSSFVRPIPRPFLVDSVIRCGRNRVDHASSANHVRLLCRDTRTGEVDQILSRQISGCHLELSVQDDQLRIRDRSTNGTWLNHKKLQRNTSSILRDKDVLRLLVGVAPRPLRFRVGFESSSGCVHRVVMEQIWK
jgi:hypothetical protein